MSDTKYLAHYGLKALLDKGANEAGCSVTVSRLKEFNFETDRFTLYRSNTNHSVSMVSIEEGRYATLAENNISEDGLKAQAKLCLETGKSSPKDPCRRIAPEGKEIKTKEGSMEYDEEKLFARCAELIETVKERYPTIVLERFIAAYQKQESCAVYSNGGVYESERGFYSASLMYGSKSGEKSSSFYYQGLLLPDLESPWIEIDGLDDDISKVSVQWDSRPLASNFEGTVLMTPNQVEGIFEDVISNFCGDSGLMLETSLWKNKLGDRVADKRLNLRIEPLNSRFLGGSRHTAEGAEAKNYTIIESGTLKNFALSDFAALKKDLPAAPNSEAPGYMVINAGDKSVQEIIGSIKKGILVMRLSGGMPAANGDFSAVAKNSFLIENGEIKYPLRELMINGNLADMMNSIKAISKETRGGYSSKVPFMAFEPMLISGAE